jgi:hypothetical protein
MAALQIEGSLSGSCDGRPIAITADARGICLTVDSVRSAWRLRRQLPALQGVLGALGRGRVPIRLKIGSVGEFSVPAIPNWMPRWALRLAGLR